MNNEYGIACLLDNESKHELQDCVPYLDKKNIPHISLFQFKCDDLHILENMYSYLSDITISNKYITSAIKVVEDNIFLNISDDSSLQYASNRCAEFYSVINHNILPLTQIDLSSLKESELEYVKRYGIYWIKDNFIPHVTLSYQDEFEGEIIITIPKIVKVLDVNIYAIDTLGKITSDQPIFK